MPVDDSLNRLYCDLGLKRPNLMWAKIELLFGLWTTAVGLIGAIKCAALPEAVVPVWTWAGFVLLVTFGGYLALAGHRSHLYQSNNRLTAYLADLVRSHQSPQSETSL